ncbi:hypothetical protein [Paenibacillus eucommiae]|uniref:Uncharacterized protein n=1 Tax=Paenibacillus eucommiae TaxID=1355755 RepID=A0ABS4IRN6_9BACL|nr:hypothetical protein [Paenibacillus eucommiae]MBP1990231.1 hypothetical protein [Paenibacillus eucommiae]
MRMAKLAILVKLRYLMANPWVYRRLGRVVPKAGLINPKDVLSASTSDQ